MRIFTTSVGLATEIPIAPVVIPANIFYKSVGFTPGAKGPVIVSLTGT